MQPQTRIDEAYRLLTKAQKSRNPAQRRIIIKAVRHLIAHLAGKPLVPKGADSRDFDQSTMCPGPCGGKRLLSGRELCAECEKTPGRSKEKLVEACEERQKAFAAHENRINADLERLGSAGVEKRYLKGQETRKRRKAEKEAEMPDKVNALFDQILKNKLHTDE